MSLVRRAIANRGESRDATLSDLMIQRDRLSSTYAGITVNPLTSLGLSAVWACINLLTNTVATLPIRTFRNRAGDHSPLDTNPPVVESPSGVLSRSEWVSQVMHSVLSKGNAYGIIVDRDSQGFPTQIELRDPVDVSVIRAGKTGPPIYRVDSKPVESGDVFHVRGLTPPGGIVGIPVVEAARNTIGVGLAAERYGAMWFADGAHPSSVLASESQMLTEEQAKIVKHRFLSSIRGREPVVLGAGLKYQPIQTNPDQSQLHETQRFVVEQVARFFGMAPEMIGGATSGQSVTYANREQRAMDFVTFAVMPWLVRIEEPWSALTPRGQYVRFIVDELLRSDTLTRYQAKTIAIRGGWMSGNEARNGERMDGIGAVGDQYLWPPYAVKEESTDPISGTPDLTPSGA